MSTIVEAPRSLYPGTLTFALSADLVRKQPGVTAVTLTTNSMRVVFETLYVTLNHEMPLRLDGSAFDEYLQALRGLRVPVKWIDTYHLFKPTSDDMFIIHVDFADSVAADWPYRTSEVVYMPGSRPAAEYGHLSVIEGDQIWNLYNTASLKGVFDAS